MIIDAISGNNHLVMTAGLHPHEDHIWGPCMMLVLQNDGLFYRTIGQNEIVHYAGKWYLFDDRLEHEVDKPEPVGTCVGDAVYCAVVF